MLSLDLPVGTKCRVVEPVTGTGQSGRGRFHPGFSRVAHATRCRSGHRSRTAVGHGRTWAGPVSSTRDIPYSWSPCRILIDSNSTYLSWNVRPVRFPRKASIALEIKPCVEFHLESSFQDLGRACRRRAVSGENRGSSQRLGPRARIDEDQTTLVCGVGEMTVAGQNAAAGRSAGGTSISQQ